LLLDQYSAHQGLASRRRTRQGSENGKAATSPSEGNVGQFQQTFKKWPAAQNSQPATPAQLRVQPDAFTIYPNTRRPGPATVSCVSACAAGGCRLAWCRPPRIRRGRPGAQNCAL
jgi:hypothetical protein